MAVHVLLQVFVAEVDVVAVEVHRLQDLKEHPDIALEEFRTYRHDLHRLNLTVHP